METNRANRSVCGFPFRGTAAVLGVAILLALFVIVSPGVAQAQTGPVVQTDRLDYYPGENVIITGSGWYPGELVKLVIHEEPPLDPDLTLYSTCDDTGAFLNDVFWTDIHDVGVTFTLTATGMQSGLTAQTVFTDSQANLDQWANLPKWQEFLNGNLGQANSLYYEGVSIPYRITFGGLEPGPHTVVIEWDTTKGGHHAIDYLTSYIQPNPGFPQIPPNPCLGVSSCNPADFTTFPIPADPQVTGALVAPVPGVFTFYGATITSVSVSEDVIPVIRPVETASRTATALRASGPSISKR